MSAMRLRSFPGLVACALVALAGCHRAPALSVDRAWVRLAAVPGHPAAAYLTIDGGAEPARLIAIDSPVAGASELHQSMKTGPGGAMIGMQRLDGLDLPAQGKLAFAPGGNHVMLFGVSPRVKPGDAIPLVIRFAKGQPLQASAKVVGAGDPAPY
jgi:copper(I)-binding protein